jgi:A/G-specific adenine glycosylase
MLQQTQTSRVVGPWTTFLEQFPNPTTCANAPLSDVLTAWRGLGYHRRAKALHEAAKLIRDNFEGEVPGTVRQLRTLPGVGDYTANAVASFAFGVRVAVLDTNVGRVLARALANRTLRPSEAQALAGELLPRTESASFNQAMLDLGAQFCRASPLCAQCPVAKVCAWKLIGGDDPAPLSAGVSKPQSRFVGSDRQLRGMVLETLRSGSRTRRHLLSMLNDVELVRRQHVLTGLVRDGLIAYEQQRYSLAST